MYFQGFWEDTLGVNQSKMCNLDGQIVAKRQGNGIITYLHGDHLGSVSVATKVDGTLASRQEFDSWGSVGDTAHNYIGQRLNGTGQLLFQYIGFYQ